MQQPAGTWPVPVVEGCLPEAGSFQNAYVRRHRPVLLKRAAPQLLPKAWALFHDTTSEGGGGDDDDNGGWLDRLGEILRDAVVDVATAHWALPFAGDPDKAESAKLPFPDFLDLLRAAARGMAGAEEEDSMDGSSPWERSNLYLAQSPVFERPRKGGSQPAPPLAALAPHIDMPAAMVDPRDVVTVNLWMGGKPTATTLHYDSNHNLLVVLRGCKQVQLFPPSATPQLKAEPIYTGSANHSELDVPAEPHDLFRAPRIPTAPTPWLARLEAGDVLFLPEGWWHQVDSAARTVALNYWFAGFVEEVLDGGAHRVEEDGDGDGEDLDKMFPFYLRTVLQRAVEKERRRLLEAATMRALAECRRTLGRNDSDTSDITRDEWRRLLDEALALVSRAPSLDNPDHSAPRLMQAVLCAMPMAVQLTELPCTVQMLGLDRWLVGVLLRLDPVTVEALTTTWEAADASVDPEELQAFFTAIYGHGSECLNVELMITKAQMVKSHLFQAKGEFAREAMVTALGTGAGASLCVHH